MLGELAALGAALSWAGGSLIIKPMTTRFSPLSLNTLRNAAAWPVMLILVFLTGKTTEVSSITSSAAIYIIGSGVIGLVIGTTLYLKALSLTDIVKVYPISYSCWLLGTVFIAAVFLGEGITWSTIVGALVILLGIVLLVVPSASYRKQVGVFSGMADMTRGITLSVIAGILWSVSIAFLKLGLASTNALVVNFIRLPVVFLLLAIFASQEKNSTGLVNYDRKALGWASLTGLLDQVLGGILFFISIQLAGAAKATILSGTSPLFVTVLAVLFLKEKVTPRIMLGTLCGVLGIWLTF